MARILCFNRATFLFIWIYLLRKSEASNLVCYCNTSRVTKVSEAIDDLKPALESCNFLVFSYMQIDSLSYELKALNGSLSTDLFREMFILKQKYPRLILLLSVGGGDDNSREPSQPPEDNKYLKLLENLSHRTAFINSAQKFVKTYGFNGLDLAWQFPATTPHNHSENGLRRAWNAVKNWFIPPKSIDPSAEKHKAQFVQLLRELRHSLSQVSAILTLTVLPNVQPSMFLDIPQIMPEIDLVTLANTFDFLTPLRNPNWADYTSPIYELFERDPTQCLDYQVQYWLNHTTELSKIILGVPAFGRAWVMTKASGLTGYPPIPVNGTAPAGNYTATPGLLSWPEICVRIHKDKELTGDQAPLRKVGDPVKRFGTYAYRSADDEGKYGLWVSYEEPATAGLKAAYSTVKDLGGVALFDLTLDDVKGECGMGQYSILRSLKDNLIKGKTDENKGE